jgi:hypothetical protein
MMNKPPHLWNDLALIGYLLRSLIMALGIALTVSWHLRRVVRGFLDECVDAAERGGCEVFGDFCFAGVEELVDELADLSVVAVVVFGGDEVEPGFVVGAFGVGGPGLVDGPSDARGVAVV